MSITAQTARTGPYVMAAFPQACPTGFAFQQSSDLLVINAGQASAPRDPAVTLTLGSDYTVTGGGYLPSNQMQTGTVTIQSGGVNACIVGDVIWVLRNVPENQIASATAAALTPILLEEALDKSATIAQQQQEQLGRALQFENFETLSPVLSLKNRKSNLLGFDANGSLQFYPASTTAQYTTFLVTPQQFGATGGGTAAFDDWAAFTAAIAYAVANNGKSVFVPAGTYYLSQSLILPNNFSLIGEVERVTDVDPNTQGVQLITSNAITVLKSASVSGGGDTYGIKIRNISIKGSGLPSGTNAITLGFANIANLCYKCEISNVFVRACFNGILLNRPAYTVLNNVTLNGADLTASQGLTCFLSQGCTAYGLQVSDYAINAKLSGQGCNFYASSFNFALSSDASCVSLLQLSGAYHCNFYGCIFENLATTATAIKEVSVYATTGDTFNTVDNTFYSCTWNGVIASAGHVEIGKAANPITAGTNFINCTFSDTLTTNVVLTNAVRTTFMETYRITNYSGLAGNRPVTSGTDASLRFIDVNGYQFPSTQVPSTNVNTLDDYVEATWTPTITFGGAAVGVTYATQDGTYTKIGRSIQLRCRMTLSSKGSSTGAAVINGIPAAIVPGNIAIATVEGDVMNAAITQPIGARIGVSATTIGLFTYSAGNYGLVTDASCTNSTDFLVTAIYNV